MLFMWLFLIWFTNWKRITPFKGAVAKFILLQYIRQNITWWKIHLGTQRHSAIDQTNLTSMTTFSGLPLAKKILPRIFFFFFFLLLLFAVGLRPESTSYGKGFPSHSLYFGISKLRNVTWIWPGYSSNVLCSKKGGNSYFLLFEQISIIFHPKAFWFLTIW